MDIISYTLYLVKNLVHESDLVKVSEIDNNEKEIILEVLVKDTDMGAIIGKNGTTAKAIRNLVEAYSYLHEKKRVKINFDSF